MNLLSNLDQVSNVIIRPSRYFYKISDLGSKTLKIDDKNIVRKDFQVKNNRGHTLKGSIFTPFQQLTKIKNVIVYLHCNSGCRIQGMAYLNVAIKCNFSYVLFDFSGSGNSQGKYISLGKKALTKHLGYYQVDDLAAIIDYLKQNISPWVNIALWGRSMGAVTGLRYLNLNPKNFNVKMAVFDSPFQSLKQLFLQIGKQKTGLPSLVLQVAYKYLKPVIQQKAEFNIDDVDLTINKSQQISIPAIFIASKNDTLIPFTQINRIYNNYAGKKQMFFIEQSHNQSRCTSVIKKVFKDCQKFFVQQVNKQYIKDIKFNYHSFDIPKKINQQSKKKLQLTIKSFSQKALVTNNINLNLSKKNLHNGSKSQLQKRQASSDIFARKSSAKLCQSNQNLQCILQQNRNSLQTRRNPISIKKFFKQQKQNQEQSQSQSKNQIKFKPKIEWNKGLNINMNISLNNDENLKQQKDKEKQRKTFQNSVKKRFPFCQLKHPNQLRNSLQVKSRKKYNDMSNYIFKQKI